MPLKPIPLIDFLPLVVITNLSIAEFVAKAKHEQAVFGP